MRARRDDRPEARRFGTEPAHPQLELDRNVALGAPGQPRFEHAAQRLVGELGRGTQALQLALVLDRTQSLDGAAGRLEPPAAGQLRAGARAGRRVRLASSKPSVPAAPARAGRRPRRAGSPTTISRSNSPATCSADCARVAEVGEERADGAARRRRRRRDQRQPAAAGEAGQVADVDRPVDDQRVELALAQLDGQSRRARRRLGCRSRRSSLGRPRQPVAQSARAPRRSRRRRDRRPSRSTARRSPKCGATARVRRRLRGAPRRPAARRSPARRGSPRRSASRRPDSAGSRRSRPRARAAARRTRPRSCCGRSVIRKPSCWPRRLDPALELGQRQRAVELSGRAGPAGRG